MHIQKSSTRLRLFTTTATLATPQDMTLQEPWIESFFPMDDETRTAFRNWAAVTGGKKPACRDGEAKNLFAGVDRRGPTPPDLLSVRVNGRCIGAPPRLWKTPGYRRQSRRSESRLLAPRQKPPCLIWTPIRFDRSFGPARRVAKLARVFTHPRQRLNAWMEAGDEVSILESLTPSRTWPPLQSELASGCPGFFVAVAEQESFLASMCESTTRRHGPGSRMIQREPNW